MSSNIIALPRTVAPATTLTIDGNPKQRMTLGNMRELGVSCLNDACPHIALIDVIRLRRRFPTSAAALSALFVTARRTRPDVRLTGKLWQ
jgi:hypothetical protein